MGSAKVYVYLCWLGTFCSFGVCIHSLQQVRCISRSHKSFIIVQKQSAGSSLVTGTLEALLPGEHSLTRDSRVVPDLLLSWIRTGWRHIISTSVSPNYGPPPGYPDLLSRTASAFIIKPATDLDH